MEKRIQEITQENQKFKQEKMEIEKNKSMLEVTKAEENNPKLQKELDTMKIEYEDQKKEIKLLKNQIDSKERHKKRLNEAFTQFESELIELKKKLEYAESSKGIIHILRKHLYSTKLTLNIKFLIKNIFPSISYYFHIPKIFLNFFPHTGKNRNRQKSNLLP